MNREDYDMCLFHLLRVRRLVNNANIHKPGVYTDLSELLDKLERKLKDSL